MSPFRPSKRRAAAATAVGACAVLLMTACAPPEATSSSNAAAGIDPAVTAAIAKEGQVRFHDGQYMENSLQAHLMKELVTTLGGKASVVVSGPAEGAAELCKSDDMVSMDFWRWQFEDGWQEYVVQKKCIVEVGTSDYHGEEGWYVPTYVIKGDPERGIEPMCPELPDWKALNKCVDVFKTAKTAPKGQFMSGAESWAPAYGDPQRIKNLGLNYEMVFAGSEAALFAELTRAYEQGKPWLGLMWRPNYMTHKYDLTRVEFPPHTEECWGKTYACQWPETVIYQVASAGLRDKHPTVWNILQKYSLNDEQLHALQSLVVDDGMSIEQAAKTWIEQNPEVWKAWL
jgi:glycine betaine/proline transport system substrate-binding protein